MASADTQEVQINDIGGLPAHPLIVHLPVVLVPLATIGAVLMLVRPSWRQRFGVPTAVLAVIAAIATQLAIESGESLEHAVGESDLIETHSHIAEQAQPWIFLFAAVMVAVVVWDLVQRRRSARPSTDAESDATDAGAPGGTTTAVVTRPTASVRSRATTVAVTLTAVGVVLGIGSTVQVYRTGHSGAKATWNDTTQDNGGGGDSDGD